MFGGPPMMMPGQPYFHSPGPGQLAPWPPQAALQSPPGFAPAPPPRPMPQPASRPRQPVLAEMAAGLPPAPRAADLEPTIQPRIRMQAPDEPPPPPAPRRLVMPSPDEVG